LKAGPLAVSCPDGISLDPSAHFVCRAETGGGAIAKVFVDVGTGEGVRRRLHLIAYRKRAVLGDIRRRFRSHRRHGGYGLADISCPRTFSARPGTAFECPAEFTDGVRNPIVVRVESRRGRYLWFERHGLVGGRGSALH
jgi:hypothetical protein